MDDRAFEEALDHLLFEPPEQFVGARNALVRSLKSAGRKEDAAALARWRRPTRTAWALNRLAQVDHDVVVALVDAAAAVRDNQAVGGTALREAMAGLRSVTRTATDAGVSAIAPSRPTDHADISAALLAVLSDGDALDLLATGRLLEIPESGLGAFASGPAPAHPGRASTESVPSRPEPGTGREEEAAQRRAAREALRDARSAAREAKAIHARAAAEAEDRDGAMRLAGERLDRSRAELAEAEAAAEEARGAAESAAAAAATAADALADAERAVSELEASAEG